MNTDIVFASIQIIGFAILAFAPFDRRRIRARWANCVFGICSIIGIARGVACLARSSDWFALSSQASRRFDSYYDLVGGLLLGFLFSLIFSGQLSGTKRAVKQPPNNSLQATAAAPSSCD
jgi:hypothetical protein